MSAERNASVAYATYCSYILNVNIFQKGSRACKTRGVISPYLVNTFKIDHCRTIVSAAIENRYSYTLRLQMIGLHAQLFLCPQLIPHM